MKNESIRWSVYNLDSLDEHHRNYHESHIDYCPTAMWFFEPDDEWAGYVPYSQGYDTAEEATQGLLEHLITVR